VAALARVLRAGIACSQGRLDDAAADRATAERAILGDVSRYVISVGVTLGFGMVLGFRVTTSPLAAVAGCALVLAFALAMCWLSALIGLLAKTPQGVQIFGFTAMFPIVFASGILVDPDDAGLAPGIRAVEPDDSAIAGLPGTHDRRGGRGPDGQDAPLGAGHRSGVRAAGGASLPAQVVDSSGVSCSLCR
jgi:ABC-2 type transporter